MDIQQLYVENSQNQIKMMTRILRGDWAQAEDVVHEAYARALQYQDSYDPKRAKISTWFNKILFNALRDVQQEYNNRPQETTEEVSTEDLDMKEIDERVVQAINKVKNEKHQSVLWLFFVKGYNSKEISQIEDEVSQTNVTTIINRFKSEVCDKLD